MIVTADARYADAPMILVRTRGKLRDKQDGRNDKGMLYAA